MKRQKLWAIDKAMQAEKFYKHKLFTEHVIFTK